MADTIKLKRSAVASKVPLTTDLELGEIAINTYDGKMFIKKDDGAESVVEIGSDAAWGSITGTLSDQTDLQSALDGKLDKSGGAMTGRLAILTIGGTAAEPTLHFDGDSDTGFYRVSPNSIGISAAGMNVVTIDTNSVDFNQTAYFYDNGVVPSGKYIEIISQPTSNTHAANKQYVDNKFSTINNFTDVTITTPSSGQVLRYDGSGWVNDTDVAGGTAAWGGITGTLSDQTDLQSALDGKASTTHSHAISDVTNLQTNLDALKTFAIQLVLEAGANNTYTLLQSAPYAFTISSAHYQTTAGTISANVKIGGTSVTGLSALSLSSTANNATATAANSVSVGNKIEVTFSSNSSATFVTLMLTCVRA